MDFKFFLPISKDFFYRKDKKKTKISNGYLNDTIQTGKILYEENFIC